jgi:hypothetical protein
VVGLDNSPVSVRQETLNDTGRMFLAQELSDDERFSIRAAVQTNIKALRWTPPKFELQTHVNSLAKDCSKSLIGSALALGRIG